MPRITRDNRFSLENPCPVCGGHQQEPKGIGRRCHGFKRADERWAYCTREEYAGKLDKNPNSGTFCHDTKGPCRCGVPHVGSQHNMSLVASLPPAPPPGDGNGGTSRARVGPVTYHDIRDENGKLVARHGRRYRADGTKIVWWEGPDGTKGLPDGLSPRDLPLYGLLELLKTPPGSPVIVCEGEKAAQALLDRGIPAVGTVTGAGAIPSIDVLSPLLRYKVVLWPDNADDGRTHMDGIAAVLGRLQEADDRAPLWRLDWPRAHPKDDAYDFFESGGTADEIGELLASLQGDGPAAIEGGRLRVFAVDSVAAVTSRAIITPLSEVERERVRWLWPGRIPLGKLTVIEGDPGLGKSLLTLQIAARVTTGGPMPDGTQGDLSDPSGVVLLSAEDGLGDTIRPRLEAAGADLGLVVALEGVREGDGLEAARFPDLSDLDEIREAIQMRGAKLVAIDPLMAYLPANVNAYRDQDVRRELAPLSKLAEVTGAAVVVVRHLNKNAGVPAIYRGGGAIGIGGAARSVLLIAKDPDDPAGQRRVLATQKQNLAGPSPSLAFRVVPDDSGVPMIDWEGESPHTAASLLAAGKSRPEGSKLDDALDFLTTVLSNHKPVTATQIEALADANGIRLGTLRRAKQELGVVSRREGFGRGSTVFWELPDEPRAVSEPGSDEPPQEQDDHE
jgi:hypothetical protein